MNPQPPTLPPTPDSARAVVARAEQNQTTTARPIGVGALQETEQRLRSGSILEQVYRPQLPIYSARGSEVLSNYFFADVEVMRMDDSVRLPLSYVMGPLYYAEWVVEANSRAVAVFVAKMLQWWWQHALPAIAQEGYTYGWAATELDYTEENSLLVFNSARTFSPRDCFPLIHNKTRRPVGIRVTGSLGGHKDLWAWRDKYPNKGFWYTHQPRYGLLVGESQIRPAWRPWRRLCGVDGVQEIQDMATYKHGVGVTIVKHPNERERAEDSANPRYARDGWVHTHDVARAIVQNSRSGGALTLSSETWGTPGGGPKWDYSVESFNANIEQLGQHDDRLSRRCSRAIGVPPELFEAAQTGSGYSGRAIPLQGFLVGQQVTLNHLTALVLKNAILPLARWNYGGQSWAKAMPKPLLETVRRASWDAPGDPDSQQRAAQSNGVDLPSGEMPSNDDGEGTGDDATPTMMSRTPTAFRDPATMDLPELLNAVELLKGLANAN